MGTQTWQSVAILLATALAVTGIVTYTDLFSGLTQLKGIDYSYSGSSECTDTCESYVNITTSYWAICFGHYNDTKYSGSGVLFKKVARSRTLHVNLDLVNNIINTNPDVKIDWLVPARGAGNWRPVQDGDCWDRGKVNRIKLVGYKEYGQTVIWDIGIEPAGVTGIE